MEESIGYFMLTIRIIHISRINSVTVCTTLDMISCVFRICLNSKQGWSSLVLKPRQSVIWPLVQKNTYVSYAAIGQV